MISAIACTQQNKPICEPNDKSFNFICIFRISAHSLCFDCLHFALYRGRRRSLSFISISSQCLSSFSTFPTLSIFTAQALYPKAHFSVKVFILPADPCATVSEHTNCWLLPPFDLFIMEFINRQITQIYCLNLAAQLVHLAQYWNNNNNKCECKRSYSKLKLRLFLWTELSMVKKNVSRALRLL